MSAADLTGSGQEGIGVDVGEFEEFFELMRPRLLRHAMRSLDADTANEAAISALHTIWTKNLPAPSTHAEELQLHAFAYRVLEGNIRNARRASARRARLLDAVAEHHLTDRTAEPDVADQVQEREAEDSASLLLAQLPERERAVVTLVVEGFRVAEIAEILGSSPGAVSMRLRRARNRLAQVIRGEVDR